MSHNVRGIFLLVIVKGRIILMTFFLQAHQRQLLLFGENSGKYLHSYSKDFEKAFTDILKRQYNEKRVHANVVYQQYIGDKEHVHMNSTCWVTLTSFVKHLGRTGKAIIDETEKGWYVTWVEKDQETLERERKAAKKDRMTKDDEERVREYIDAQVEKAKAQSSLNESEFEATELLKNDDEQLKLDLKMKNFNKVQDAASGSKEMKNVFKITSSSGTNKEKDVQKMEKRKISALEEIMTMDKAQKKKKSMEQDKNSPKDRSWLRKGIIVKVITKSLGDKYYKKKGYVKEVIDDFAALIVMNDTGAKVKLDQDHLETVVPQEGREVIILWGESEGQTAILKGIDTEKFCASLKLESGEKVKLPYEQFSKKM